MSKYQEVKSRLVLSKHARENLEGARSDGADRSNIGLHRIIKAIAYGERGYAYNGNHKKTLNGVEVIYKIGKSGEYVVITYYRVKPHKYINIVDRLLGSQEVSN